MSKIKTTPVAESIPVSDAFGIIDKTVQEALESHVSRHNPNGPDAIATANVAALNPDLGNSEGSAGSVSRSDHVHNVPTAIAVSVGTNTPNSQGVSTSFSRADHVHKVSLPTFQAYSSTDTTTTSATDVILDSMTITPGAGTYLVLFVSSVSGTSNNNVTVVTSIYQNGTQIPTTEIETIPRSSNQSNVRAIVSNIGIATVAAGQAIDIRWRRSEGTITAFARKLQLVRVA